MRGLTKKLLSWVAIYAVAVHTLLTGIGPAFATAQENADPLSVICLHDAGAAVPADQQPAGLLPGHACEHCNVCSAVTAAVPEIVLIGNLLPPRLLRVLHPASAAPNADVAYRPN